jgi:hypothetical protein
MPMASSSDYYFDRRVIITSSAEPAVGVNLKNRRVLVGSADRGVRKLSTGFFRAPMAFSGQDWLFQRKSGYWQNANEFGTCTDSEIVSADVWETTLLKKTVE